MSRTKFAVSELDARAAVRTYASRQLGCHSALPWKEDVDAATWCGSGQRDARSKLARQRLSILTLRVEIAGWQVAAAGWTQA